MTAPPELPLDGAPFLEYLPTIELEEGRLLGFEALVRWQHPTEGRIAPNVLLPWAEANGVVDALDEWIFAEACSQATRWSPGMQVGVNCAIAQLQQGKAFAMVSSAIEGSGLSAERLVIEITEQSLLDPAAVAELKRIGALGVLLAVDDVGSSWSTFEPIKNLAISTVKIDRQFVNGLEPDQGVNRLVVETVLRLTHSAGIGVLLEGVEEEYQLAIARELGADSSQGFFFAKPLSEEEALVMGTADPPYRFPLGNAAHVKARPIYAQHTQSQPERIEDMVSFPEAPELGDVPDADLDELAEAVAAMLRGSETRPYSA